MCEHPLGAFAAYNGIITIVSCAKFVSGFVTSFKVSHPVPLHYIYGESKDIIDNKIVKMEFETASEISVISKRQLENRSSRRNLNLLKPIKTMLKTRSGEKIKLEVEYQDHKKHLNLLVKKGSLRCLNDRGGT